MWSTTQYIYEAVIFMALMYVLGLLARVWFNEQQRGARLVYQIKERLRGKKSK